MCKKEHDLEQQLSKLLESEEQGRKEVSVEALRKLQPRYEIRIQAQFDPVEAETALFRKMAEEVDDRYERYDEDKGEKNN